MAELKHEKYFMKDTGFKSMKTGDHPFGKFEVPKIHHIISISNRKIEGSYHHELLLDVGRGRSR
jgi:hypothetical protein